MVRDTVDRVSWIISHAMSTFFGHTCTMVGSCMHAMFIHSIIHTYIITHPYTSVCDQSYLRVGVQPRKGRAAGAERELLAGVLYTYFP